MLGLMRSVSVLSFTLLIALSVQTIELIPYAYDRTYDILPSSSTGSYFAAGALLGSTLWSPGLKVTWGRGL